MKFINSKWLNQFFEYSGRILIFPLLLAFVLLNIFYRIPSTYEYFYILIAASWTYLVLFLGFDIPVSFFAGKTGVYHFKAHGPRVLVRGESPAAKSFTILLVIKCFMYVCVIAIGIVYFQIFNT